MTAVTKNRERAISVKYKNPKGALAAGNSNALRLVIVTAVAVLAIILYMTVNVRFDNPRLFQYSMRIRSTKVVVMMIVAFCIGGASMVFQSVIKNTIVTPCLLGMNSLYTLIHTAVVFFFGAGSLLVRDSNAAFAADLALMGVVATFIYSYMFKKTKYNVLYVLLIGAVLTSFFSSIQTTMVRVMDPNEYESLLATLVASFSNVNANIILLSLVMMILIILALRKDLALLDVITLGKDQAVNLGVDYDRTIKRLLLGVALFIAIATALVGPISFLGLIIANLSRQMLKTYRHSYLILGSALIGTALLIGGQLIVEQAFVYSVPISVFITVGGGLYFLYLLLTHKRRA
jgi:iron complex transport system permease protein